MLKKTKIVATVGPASEKEEILRQMIINGVNVFRLNFSHGTHEYHKKNLDTIRKVAKELHIRIGILQDISGPKIRTGELKEPFELKKGDRLDFYRETILGEKIAQNHYKISINQKSILDMLKIDEYIYLYDGSIRAKVVNIDDQKIETIIENDGFLNSNKGINFPNTKINIDVITQKDKNDLLWGIKNEVDFLAISFVQNAHDIDEVREILAQNNAKISIFAKIEKFDAVENIDEIIKSSDGIMVARGDLGIEVPYYKVPNIQKEIIQKANNASKPVITATQMLFSLAKSKTATRAEISDVANAVLDGTDAVMLSEESAVGIDPANAVGIMCQTIIETEKRYPYNKFNDFNDLDNTDKIMRSSAHLATDLNADAIFSLTSSGKSAIKIARYRPNIEIIAVGHSEKTLNSLSIVWGVNPAILVNKSNELTELLKDSVRSSVEKGFMDEDKCYLLTAGFPTGVEGTSNLIRILNKEQIAYYLQ
ncbi:pyruvate kinase [Campylobacter jejuni]|uniref:Pyruvate kinase n=1 Tax=Campylobacter jejuni subsp. jejuni serotype O:23/36 (strain 81-176) TaxID=354242 RepID=A0A0H3PIY7_CAMJJ|nr:MULTISPECIES: pyruvate kinase [Campylobacter]EAK5450417.1 pyruvate kinase [Campylobacter hyointestinalis]ETN90393.1 pyruvate kinase [Campylobacter jejuni subsp. jejuni 81-176-UMCW9]ANS23484.1 pyruvate kinase I [Campylobacter jejuni subsp. jejuni]ASI86945.1 Pyruvate kinase [Campylobacter jejuni]ASN49481.1 pyruvate kinase [Campylobacter jejuni]